MDTPPPRAAGPSRLARLDPADYALDEAIAERLFSPALVVHLDRVRENLRRVLAHMQGDAARWRPHLKTTKLPEVWRELLRAGVRSFKCATTREARVFAELAAAERVAGVDLLVAYPLVGPALGELGRIAEDRRGVAFSVLCEDALAVDEVPARVGVFADLDPGMHRTGVALSQREGVLDLARAAGPRFRGLHFYDGHRHEADLAERGRLAFAGYDELRALASSLAEHGFPPRELVTSGTPAFLHALAYEPFRRMDGCVHRVSPGTVVFHDLRSDEENPELELVPAALVFARVVSRPSRELATCDAGSKSIAAEAGDPCAFVLGRPELLPLAPSEEHLPLRILSGEGPPRGATLHLVPRHVCPTVNLAEEVLLVDGGEVLGSTRVAARAHPLFAELTN